MTRPLKTIHHPKHPTVETRWQLIDSPTAHAYLSRNDHNRKVPDDHVTRLADDMAAKRYEVTHQGIAIDTNGVLLDGQQRCLAVIKSGTAQWMLVTTGLPPTSQSRMDLGRRREVGQFLDGKHRSLRASAHRLLLGFELCRPTLTAPDLGMAMRMLTVPGTLEQISAVEYAMCETLAPAALRASYRLAFGPSPLLAATVAVFGDDVERATTFLNGFATLENLQPGDPRLVLMRKRGTDGKRITQEYAAMFALKTVQAWAADKRMTRMSTTGLTITL